MIDFFVQRVQKYGWLSVGHVFCDNGYTINPFTSGGEVCMSVAQEMIFSAAAYDSADTANLEKYVVGNPIYSGLQKSIVCIGFEHMQHFDINLFNQEISWSNTKDIYPIPALPIPSVIEGIALDSKTGLSDDHTVAECMDGRKVAVYDLYPDMDIQNTSGLRIKAYQDFQKKQKLFTEAVKKLTGIGDCF